MRRARCGTISPTKPTIPESETADAVSSVADPSKSHCARATSTPTARAIDVPKRNAFSDGTAASAQAMPTIAYGAVHSSSLQPRPASEPVSQARTESAPLRASLNNTSATNDEKSADNETQARYRRTAP